MADDKFQRTRLLVGDEAMERLHRCRVLLVGVGGVGSWAAEGLVRSGIGHLTIVDADCVDVTNINRQLPATSSTVGEPKVEVLARRLRDINPDADIVALQMFYDDTTASSIDLEEYDYVVDAIDSLASKALLILSTTAARRPRLFSSMGAALKDDPSSIHVAEFWKVKGCPLARALRDRFKRAHTLPRRKFRCVYSDQLLRNDAAVEAASAVAPGEKRPNGTLAHITAIFGFTLSALVVNDLTHTK